MKFLILCTTTIDLSKKVIESQSYISQPDGQIIYVKEKVVLIEWPSIYKGCFADTFVDSMPRLDLVAFA